MRLDLGLEPTDIDVLFEQADQDGDGLVNATEFMEFSYSALLFLVREHVSFHNLHSSTFSSIFSPFFGFHFNLFRHSCY
jgi:hypothetical protein